METADLTPLLEQLEDNIDDIEDVLEPLFSQSLSATTQKMPVLDKAKLHVLITYTIESLIFSYLRLRGINAKEHAVWKEITRVRQYFDKIKALETEPEKRTLTLDKQAAGRFIKHGLAGNDKYDLERAEREAKEKAMAQLKAARLSRQQTVPQKRSAEEEEDSSESLLEEAGEQETDERDLENATPNQLNPPIEEQRKKQKKNKNKKEKDGNNDNDNENSIDTNEVDPEAVKQQRKEKKRQKQQAKRKRNSEKKAAAQQNV